MEAEISAHCRAPSDAVVNNDPCRTLVKVKKGTYREIVNIPSGKANMTWLGEDRDTTIMAAYNFEGFNSAQRLPNADKDFGQRVQDVQYDIPQPEAKGLW